MYSKSDIKKCSVRVKITERKTEYLPLSAVMVEKEVAGAATIPEICSSVLLMYFRFGINCTYSHSVRIPVSGRWRL